MQKMGISKEESKNIIEKAVGFKEGDKVKIDYDYITGRKNYDSLTDKYKTFISENKDKIFTLEKDGIHKSFFVFKEDDTEPKWLWFGTDLIKIKEDC
jgi:hypothetical protein